MILTRPFLVVGAMLAFLSGTALAEIDGHGPDAWRVTGVAANDVLNMRSGPGTQYAIIGSLGPSERGLEEITCVPFLPPAVFTAMRDAQRRELPPRWCLMRDAALAKAGWVAQRFLTPDDATQVPVPKLGTRGLADGDPVMVSTNLVRALYEAHLKAVRTGGAGPLSGSAAQDYFTSELAAAIHSGQIGADPLLDAQDFDGEITRIAADPEQPMLRGMVTIIADYVNFGQPRQARLYLRADTDRPNAPFRIFGIEHEGWAIP